MAVPARDHAAFRNLIARATQAIRAEIEHAEANGRDETFRDLVEQSRIVEEAVDQHLAGSLDRGPQSVTDLVCLADAARFHGRLEFAGPPATDNDGFERCTLALVNGVAALLPRPSGPEW